MLLLSLDDIDRQGNADPQRFGPEAEAPYVFDRVRAIAATIGNTLLRLACLRSFGMECRIADELIAMAELDQKVGDELARSGALYEGYDPRMAAIHEKNALRLQAIMV